MTINVNWADVSLGLIILVIATIAAATYCFLEYHRIHAEERRQRKAFERDMANAQLPEYNGDTYDWDAQTLAYLSDTHVYAGPGVADTVAFPAAPVPPSTISGPLPTMDLDADAAAFIAKMKKDNDAWLAKVREVQ